MVWLCGAGIQAALSCTRFAVVTTFQMSVLVFWGGNAVDTNVAKEHIAPSSLNPEYGTLL